MHSLELIGFLVVLLLAILASGIWIGLALLGVGWIGIALFTGRPVGDSMVTTIWGASSNWTLTALPMFIWMGELLFRSRLSADMFTGLAPWMGRLPGRLLHTNVIGCAIFVAVSGSSAATCVTIGRMTVPELRKRGYPEAMVICAVLGSIYTGIATATEAAGVGVVGALALAAIQGMLTRRMFIDSLLGATRLSCMISLILAGASFLTLAMGYTGLPRALAEWIDAQSLSPAMLIVALALFYIILGCFLDRISMVVLTIAVVLPTVERAGFDLVWFGIFVVLVVEMAQITPPVGFNLFVLQGMTGHQITDIAKVTLPFFIAMIVAIALIFVFPEIVTSLPRRMMGAAI